VSMAKGYVWAPSYTILVTSHLWSLNDGHSET
jgi:hypothetical protein